MTMNSSASVYRPCVGIILFNDEGKVFMGKRNDLWREEAEARPWQLPQGGIDKDEKMEAAARRELFEETGVKSARVVGCMDEWLYYDLPQNLRGRALNKRFKGQRQIWLAFQITGPDSEVDISGAAEGVEPEFVTWEWVALSEITARIIHFKRDIYLAVANYYSGLAASLAAGEEAPSLPPETPILGHIARPE